MTATVTTHPSSPLAALDAATRKITAGADERAYYGGFILGWAAGMTTGDNPARDMVIEARQHHYAATYTLLDADQRWQILGRNVADEGRAPYLRSCGLLAGWKEGTAHYPDAAECTTCEGRVLDADEPVSCDHGVFCSDDCARSACGFRCADPEFDDEAYHAEKYGA